VNVVWKMKSTIDEMREIMAGQLILRAVNRIKVECPKCEHMFRLCKSAYISVPNRKLMLRGHGAIWSRMSYPSLGRCRKEINAEMEKRGAAKAKVLAAMRRRARRAK